MPISIMTEKAWFGHNVNFLQHKIELSDKYDIVICCKSSIYELLKNEFYTLSFPFKNIKIGIISMDMEEFLLFFQNENNLGTLLIIVDFENVSLEYYQKSNQDAIANNWIFVHPSLSWNQLYFTQLDADLKEGIKKIRFLGHQAHVTPSQILEFAQNHSIEILRLGQIRQHIDMVEPWCRSVDHVIFHLESLRKSDFTSKSLSNPGGFTYEEACKLSQFVGASSHLNSIAFLFADGQIPDPHSMAVLSQLIWYLIDGYHNYREDKPIEKHKLTQYLVHASHRDMDINFWKNNESGRWWMEVPGHENYWISCTYDDYLEASQGEFSSKLIHALNRI